MPCPIRAPLPWQGSDAEDALQEEEEEVGRMEKEKAARMKAADFGVDDEDEEDGDSEDEEEEEDGEATLGALAKGKVRPYDTVARARRGIYGGQGMGQLRWWCGPGGNL